MDRYAVIGNPVEHSLSPKIHGLFAGQTDQQMSYQKLPAEEFSGAAESFFAGGGKGLNVTVPFKSDAAAWVDETDEAARAAGAVNTIALRDGRYRGYNTDGTGLITDLRENEKCMVKEMNVLVLGAGGAVKGVVRPLLGLAPRSLTLANRNPSKARTLADALRAEGTEVAISGCGLDEIQREYHVVINGTSAGLAGEGALIAPAAVRGAFCYDLLYSAEPGVDTPFCAWAAAAGAAKACDGLGMLVEQAAAAFAIWRGVRPDTVPVLAQLRNSG